MDVAAGPGGMHGPGGGSEGGPPGDGLHRGVASGVGVAPPGLDKPCGSDCGTNQGGADSLPRASRVRESTSGGVIRPSEIDRKARIRKARKYAARKYAARKYAARKYAARKYAARIRKAHKPKILYHTIRYDPDRLSLKYSRDEIKKMIAEGKVVEVIGRLRRVTPP